MTYAQLQSSTKPLKSSGEPSNGPMNRMSVYETLGRRDSMSDTIIPGLGSLKIKLWRELSEVSVAEACSTCFAKNLTH